MLIVDQISADARFPVEGGTASRVLDLSWPQPQPSALQVPCGRCGSPDRLNGDRFCAPCRAEVDPPRTDWLALAVKAHAAGDHQAAMSAALIHIGRLLSELARP